LAEAMPMKVSGLSVWQRATSPALDGRGRLSPYLLTIYLVVAGRGGQHFGCL
jgi:hypothetical protein